MKIHCAELVEGALRSALAPGEKDHPGTPAPAAASSLLENFTKPKESGVRIIMLDEKESKDRG